MQDPNQRFIQLPLPMALAIRDFLAAQPISVAVEAWSVLQMAIDKEAQAQTDESRE